jgi:hypothetical protein
MNHSMTSRACIFLALTALSGCYAQVEDTDVSFVQTRVCGNTNCPGGNAPLTLTSNFIPAFTLELGDSGVLTSSQSKQGPITFNGSILLIQAIVTMTTPPNADFSGVRTVDLRAAIGTDNCAQLSPTCKSIASYDFARDGAATQKLVLKGVGANLLDFASGPNHQIKLSAKATGNAPAAPAWNADAELNMSIKARGTFP